VDNLELFKDCYRNMNNSNLIGNIREDLNEKHIIYKADLLLNNIFLFDDPLDMEACYIPYHLKEINWNEKPNGDDEWTYMLNRHGFLLELSWAYKITGQKKYLDKIKELIFDWINKNNILTEKNKNAWRTIDTGIRLTNWVRTLILVSEDIKLSSKEMNIINKSLKLQTSHLENAYIDKHTLSNWGVLQLTGYLMTSIFFKDIISKDNEKWAYETLEKQLKLQFYNDGYHWEQSPLYHFEVIMSCSYLLMCYEFLNIKCPINLRELLKKPAYITYYMELLNGKLVPLHDSDNIEITSSIYILKLLDLTFDNNYSNFFEGKSSGNFIYKDLFNKTYFSIFNGRHGSGHGHSSLGHFNYSAYEYDYIVDSGRFTYVDNSPIRSFLKSSYAHNNIIIDDNPETIINKSWKYSRVGEPIANEIYDDEEYNVVKIIYSGKNEDNLIYIIKRLFLYSKNEDILVIFDIVDHKGDHEIQRSFQLHSDVLATKNNDGFLLEVHNKPIYLTSFDNNNASIKSSFISSIYNQLSNADKIIYKDKFNDLGIYVSVLSKEKLRLEKRKIVQDKNESNILDKYYFGFDIYNNKNKKLMDIFYSDKDTYEGSKLYISENIFLYGELIVNGNKVL